MKLIEALSRKREQHSTPTELATCLYPFNKHITPTGLKVEGGGQPVDEVVRPREQESVGATSHVRRSKELIAVLIVILVAGAIYGSVYFREDSISGGIGANLVPAERVLKGEVPYRDFYKIQTPGILLLNAGLFKAFGTSLLTALRGVLVFKVLTVVMVFVVVRLVVSWKAAILPTLLSFLWLPPGGPFRPAPIQYEMLFMLIALYFTLRWIDSGRALHVFAAGLSIGIVAVFKQNVGVYAAVALVIAIIGESRRRGQFLRGARSIRRLLLAAAAGVAIPLAGLVVYLLANQALGAAVRVFVQGPAEHIQMKLTGYPLPKHALIIMIGGLAGVNLAMAIGRRLPRFKTIGFSVAVFAAEVCAALAPQSFIDNSIYWFPPVLFLYALWVWFRGGRRSSEDKTDPAQRAILLVLLLFSIASYLEVFPRSVRGLLIGTLPPVFILVAVLFANYYSSGGSGEGSVPRPGRWFTLSSPRRFQLSVIAVVATVFTLRLVGPHYFNVDAGRLSFKADTELSFDRGRGVYLPSKRAEEVNATVDLIHSRVEKDGYFFAHALDATAYYFLADRNSPTGATLWNDAGTNEAERARTMQMLREKNVRLVLTSDQALENERYQSLVEFLQSSFHESTSIGRIKFLERSY